MWRTHIFTLIYVTFIVLSIPVSAAPYCGLVPPKGLSVQNSQTSKSNNEADDVVASAWYPGWLATQFAPDTLSWSKYTHVTFAFAVTSDNVSTLSLDDVSRQALPTFVSSAKSHGVKALVSIGGWTGSRFFSTAVATAENRTQFVDTVLNFADQYQLDGLDFDWEYPNHQGLGCNIIASDDSANFLSFLKALRADPRGAKLYLSGAVGITPFAGSNGTPSTDVSGFGEVFDHIAMMNYDIWGSWSSTVGPNAPLDDSCAATQAGSAESAFKAWTDAGFPAEKLVLGVASYGHSFHVDTSNALTGSDRLASSPTFDKSQQPKGDSPDDGEGTDPCGVPIGVTGVFNYRGMITEGFLSADGTAADGIDYRYDNCSQTPYVYNPKTQVMISYDDATSFAAKGQFINDKGMKGFAMWHAVGDSDDILLDAISQSMGIVQVCS